MGAARGSRPPPAGMQTDLEPPPRPALSGRRSERLGFFFLVILACVAAVAVLIWPTFQAARRIVGREDLARDALLALGKRQIEFHETSGHYGFVGDLAGAGLLEDLEVTETDGVPWVKMDGYRIDVLLPHARLGPGVVAIAPDGSEKPIDADLATRHFSVVARPLEPGVSGYRMWYVDERGELYLNEGVIDDEGAARNELPIVQVVSNATLDTARALLWQKASEVPPTED